MTPRFTNTPVDPRRLTMLAHGKCIEWDRGRDPYGYGRDGNGLVHRAAYAAAHGEIPAGLLVCHHCDNPACINPEHLFLGTHTDNGKDMSLKGRAGNQYGGQQVTRCINGHEYTPENTYWRPGKVASRDCRACIRDRNRRYRERGRAA